MRTKGSRLHRTRRTHRAPQCSTLRSSYGLPLGKGHPREARQHASGLADRRRSRLPATGRLDQGARHLLIAYAPAAPTLTCWRVHSKSSYLLFGRDSMRRLRPVCSIRAKPRRGLRIYVSVMLLAGWLPPLRCSKSERRATDRRIRVGTRTGTSAKVPFSEETWSRSLGSSHSRGGRQEARIVSQ